MKKPFLFKRGKYYHLQYYGEIGNKLRITTGEKKKSDALKFVLNFELKEKEKLRVKHISLSGFVKEYKKHLEQNFSNAYLKDVTISFDRLISFAGDIPLIKISTQLLEQMISNYAERSKNLGKKHYVNLRSAFNKARSWGYIADNPLSKFKAPKVPANNPRFITEFELHNILSKVQDEQLKAICLFAFHTGARRAEIINMKWSQISLNDKIIKIQNTKKFTTKGKKERVVPINDKLLPVLIQRVPKVIAIDNEGYVFNKNGFRLNPDYVGKEFKKALIEVETIDPEFCFHDLRHSFASNLVRNGVSLYIVQELLGHQEVSTTRRYAHLTIDSLKDAVKVLEK